MRPSTIIFTIARKVEFSKHFLIGCYLYLGRGLQDKAYTIDFDTVTVGIVK